MKVTGKKIAGDASDRRIDYYIAVQANIDPDQEWPYVVVVAGPADDGHCGTRVFSNVTDDDAMVAGMLMTAAEHVINPGVPCSVFTDHEDNGDHPQPS